MKKAILLLLGLFSLALANAQVGVNTQSPKSTFHVVPVKTDGTTAEGIIAPNLSRAELIGKDARYGTDQRGAMVYVTAVDGTANTKVAKITQVGYYYFDGSVWQPFTSSTVTIPTEPWRVQGGTTQATGNTQDIYQTGKVAIGTGATAASAYNLEVAGSSYVSGNSRVGSSTVTGSQTVAGNHTVTGTSNLNGTTNAKATNISGVLNYTPGGTAPAANTYLRTDATGNASWQALPAYPTVPTEPWMVQGGTTQATGNAQNIYQTGSVHVGANTAVTAYKFQVTGTSNITGNSRVASSTVVGAQTVGGNHTVAGTSNLNGATNVTGTLNYQPGGTAPTANTYLRTDATGNASWQALPATATTEPWRVQGGTTNATTNTQNIYQTGKVAIGTGATAASTYNLEVAGSSYVSGNSRVGSNTVVGAQTVGTTLGVTGAATMSSALTVAGTTTLNGATNAKATNISGTLNYKPGGTAPAANTYLRTDATGNASWQALPATATTEPWQVQGGTTAATTNAQNIYQTGSVHVGANTAVTAYKFQVTGASNITGNSRVGSNTVVGNETVGGTLGVTGITNLGSTLAVTGSTGLGTASPAQKLHVVGNEYVTGSAKIGSTTATLNASAQLELGDNNKGFLPNRVALTSASVKAPVTNTVDGMMVYNTASVPAQGLSPGYYYWRNNSWNRLVDNIPQTTLRVLNLQSEISSASNDANNTHLGTLMNFGSVVIPEDGSYAFSFRLYGSVSPRPATSTSIYYYIALMKATTIMDSAELDLVVGTGSVLSYSVTLGAIFKAGDVVTFRLSHHPASNYPWVLKSRPGTTAANRTSMVWWKL